MQIHTESTGLCCSCQWYNYTSCCSCQCYNYTSYMRAHDCCSFQCYNYTSHIESTSASITTTPHTYREHMTQSQLPVVQLDHITILPLPVSVLQLDQIHTREHMTVLQLPVLDHIHTRCKRAHDCCSFQCYNYTSYIQESTRLLQLQVLDHIHTRCK